MSLRIRNWEKFQHYKKRTPPWVKLHRSILDEIEWYALSGGAAKTLVMLWIIASEKDGELPDIEKLAFRLRLASGVLASQLSELTNYVEELDDSVLLAPCKQVSPLETEEEAETEDRQRREEGKLTHTEIIDTHFSDLDEDNLPDEGFEERRKSKFAPEKPKPKKVPGGVKSPGMKHDEAVQSAVIPAHLGKNPKFIETFVMWCDDRRKKKKWQTENSIKLAMSKLARVSAEDAIDSLETSVIGGYQGVFVDKYPPRLSDEPVAMPAGPNEGGYGLHD